MIATMTPADLLADLERRGFTLRAIAGSISVVPASGLTPEDRRAIRENRSGLLAVLSVAQPWDGGTASRLVDGADALVERLGVDDRQPAVAAAAGVVTSALAMRDMETIRFAVAEFIAVVRGLAALSGGVNQRSRARNEAH